MKAVENDFAKQTHCRLTVAEGKRKEVQGARDEFRSHSTYHHGRKTKELRKPQTLNRTGQNDACD